MTEETRSSARLVLSTAPDLEVARSLAGWALEARLAACVNLVPGVTSIYRWQGELQEEAELLLVFKATAETLAALEEGLLERHPYDCPELVVLDPCHVEPGYLAWLEGSLAGPGET